MGSVIWTKRKQQTNQAKMLKEYIILFPGHTVAAVQCQYSVEREVYEL